jgi:hypothetical protein
VLLPDIVRTMRFPRSGFGNPLIQVVLTVEESTDFALRGLDLEPLSLLDDTAPKFELDITVCLEEHSMVNIIYDALSDFADHVPNLASRLSECLQTLCADCIKLPDEGPLTS